MDSTSIGMIAALIFLVMMSAYFSATETAFTSLNRIRLKNKADNGDRRAQRTLDLAEDYDKLLSTILIGNNIVNNVATTIGAVLFIRLIDDVRGPTVSATVLTIVILIFGEVSPKSLAKEHPEAFAMFSAPLLRVLVLILTPLNFLFAHWKRLLSLVFPALAGDYGMFCLIGIAIFLGCTAYDTQRMRDLYYYYAQQPDMLEKAAIFSALQLYLDFINLFFYLLRFLGKSKN